MSKLQIILDDLVHGRDSTLYLASNLPKPTFLNTAYYMYPSYYEGYADALGEDVLPYVNTWVLECPINLKDDATDIIFRLKKALKISRGDEDVSGDMDDLAYHIGRSVGYTFAITELRKIKRLNLGGK